jgi:hypothetical protein
VSGDFTNAQADSAACNAEAVFLSGFFAAPAAIDLKIDFQA